MKQEASVTEFNCNEVSIRHRGGFQVSLIRFSDSVTVAKYLKVLDDGVRLTIYYMGNAGPLKAIVTPYDAIEEYTCHEIQGAKS